MNTLLRTRTPLVAILLTALGLVITSCGGGGGGGSSDDTPTNTRWNAATLLASVGNDVMPYIYDDLAQQAQQLNASAASFCAQPSESALVQVQANWLLLSTSWLNSTAVLFGPAIDNNRDFSINDVATAGTIVNDILNAALPDTITTDYINTTVGSRAKGLQSIEFLLYDTERLNPTGPLNDPAEVLRFFTTHANANRRCEYLLALSDDLHNQLVAIQNGWQANGDNFTAEIVNAGNGSAIYVTQEQAVEELVNKLAQSVERLKNVSIGVPLGKKSNNVVKPFDAQQWRSGLSVAHLQAHLEGLERIYVGLNSTGDNVYSFDDQLQQLGFNNLHIAITNQFTRTREAIAEIDGSLYDAVSTDTIDVEAAYLAADTLVALLKREMSSVLDVTIGFTSDDGD